MDAKDLARFEKYISPEPNTGCWLWTGESGGHGYGRLRLNGGRRAQAHRLAYEHFVGPIAKGLQADHLCRVRCCVNPAHIEPVTGRVNVRRGRSMGNAWNLGHTRTRGEQAGNSKLTEAQVLAIRADTRNHRAITADYGIGLTQVGRIKLRQQWAHLK